MVEVSSTLVARNDQTGIERAGESNNRAEKSSPRTQSTEHYLFLHQIVIKWVTITTTVLMLVVSVAVISITGTYPYTIIPKRMKLIEEDIRQTYDSERLVLIPDFNYYATSSSSVFRGLITFVIASSYKTGDIS